MYFNITAPSPHRRPSPRPTLLEAAVEVVRRVLQAGGLLALVGGVRLVRLVELRQELDLRDQGVDLRQHTVIHGQVRVEVPDLDSGGQLINIPSPK